MPKTCFSSLSKLIAQFSAIVILSLSIVNISAQEVTTDQTIWAYADSHGDFTELQKLLKTAKIIDENNNWIGGKSVLVSTGDVLDRGPEPRKILDMLMKLEAEAEAAGGQFLFTLGNHEVMILIGDLRYVAPEEYQEFAKDESDRLRDKYFKTFVKYHTNKHRKKQKKPKLRLDKKKVRETFDSAFPPGYFARFEAFGPNGTYGKWLLEKNFIIKVNDRLFAHGGMSPELLGKGIDEINTQLKNDLSEYITKWHDALEDSKLTFGLPFRGRSELFVKEDQETIEKFTKLENSFVFSSQSPIWYRGAIYCHPYYETESTRQLLKSFATKQLFLGHSVTPTRRVNSRLDDQVIMMDTGMLKKVYKGSGNIIKISGDELLVINSSGETYKPEPASHTAIDYPSKFTKQDIASVLQTGDPIKTEKLKAGITRPSRLTFKANGKKIRALYKYVDESPNLEKQRKTKRKSKDKYADRYHNDIAAYRLSEMMGFGLVPVSTTRELEQITGLVQYWVENSYTQHQANKKGWDYEGHCSYDAQMNMMRVFDLLIHNFDRNPSNILIEDYQGQLLWIDHSRSFSYDRNLPTDIDRSNIRLTPELKQELLKLTRENLKEVLGDLLNRNQIRAIIKRRDLILELAGAN